jgi:hypothetical protein
MSSRSQTRKPPGLPCLVREPRDSLSATGVNARKREPPRAFHGFELGSMVGQTCSPDTTTEGRSPVSRPSLALGTLATRRMADDPVRVSTFSVARRRALVKASRPRSDPSPRCLEFRFYNRRCASRAPVETSPSETVRRAPWENPPSLDFSDHPRALGVSAEPRATPDHLAVIQPPTAARLTACCRLRVDRLSPSCSEAWGEGRASLLFRLAAALSDRAL